MYRVIEAVSILHQYRNEPADHINKYQEWNNRALFSMNYVKDAYLKLKKFNRPDLDIIWAATPRWMSEIIYTFN